MVGNKQLLKEIGDFHISNDWHDPDQFTIRVKNILVGLSAKGDLSYDKLEGEIKRIRSSFFIRNSINRSGYAIQLYSLIVSMDWLLPEFSLHEVIMNFKHSLERGVARAFKVTDKPLEEIGRSLLQCHLDGISKFLENYFNVKGYTFREVELLNRKTDLIWIIEEEYLIETKIWRGSKYVEQGLAKLVDYMNQENLKEGYYIIFDDTTSRRCCGFFSTDTKKIIIKGKAIWVYCINIRVRNLV